MHPYILSCLLGFFIKLYDDMKDLYLQWNVLEECCKIGIILCSLKLFQSPKHILFNIIAFFSIIMCHLAKPLDDTFWIVYAIFLFGCLCTTFPFIHTYTLPSINIYFSNVIFMSGFLLAQFHETKTFPEEMSLRKYFARIGFIIVLILFLSILEMFHFVKKFQLQTLVMLTLFTISYFLTKILFHLLKILKIIYFKIKKNNQPKKKKNKTTKLKQQKIKQQKKGKKIKQQKKEKECEYR